MVIPPYNRGKAITKSDTVNFEFGPCEAIYVGGTGGDIVVVWQDDSTSTFTGVVAGAVYPYAAKRVNSGSTTATGLIALYTN